MAEIRKEKTITKTKQVDLLKYIKKAFPKVGTSHHASSLIYKLQGSDSWHPNIYFTADELNDTLDKLLQPNEKFQLKLRVFDLNEDGYRFELERIK
ncbi:hypothetical protein A2W39_02565 [Candidatus Azambacteria bacterium RIFCSPHIGHO2_01_46_10]|uniref:Uncharacterized protein n=4 Tax=Candidatus Azamiibacteriota TaxID=1752741 RepID=A0A1F5C8K7_9BACT|nr:MAG: hypothetical protein A2W60_00395 [Candidatus Azambacteria bacterium RIFCSPHIGHO2_02_46_12]OGD36196.1 MAG: hypothetical protein A2W39_02565 [Candidatus Azambacteria bacterium RIFCSPHIGHO2_01_46_10]OGD39170.1 MAG: hypothetical protein A3A25_01435 [Candidatus Azambacteria bacterium RIFCSPLOWO2_01_FULL_46_26]OGD44108.1 MAG: hypothetical protein A3J02_01550 [Candidatus Azambacteria bacterium RIFCSPLOWO2_02_FULL_46_11]